MGDTKTIPTFVFVVTFMVTALILVAAIPPAFSPTTEYNAPIPTEFSAVDFTQLAWYDNHTIGGLQQFMLPPTDPQIEVWGSWGGYVGEDPHSLIFMHVWMNWIWREWHFILDLDTHSELFTKSMILANWDSSKNVSSFQGMCDHGTTYFIFISYDQDAYPSLGDAIDNYEVVVLIGVGIQDTVAKLNAWNLIAQLLTFSIPGVPQPLNYILAIPIYASIIILIYILILMAIPFVGG